MTPTAKQVKSKLLHHQRLTRRALQKRILAALYHFAVCGLRKHQPGSPSSPQTRLVLIKHMTLGKTFNLSFILLNCKMGIIIPA